MPIMPTESSVQNMGDVYKRQTPYRTEGMRYWGSVYEEQLKDLCIVNPSTGNMSSPESSVYILPRCV